MPGLPLLSLDAKYKSQSDIGSSVRAISLCGRSARSRGVFCVDSEKQGVAYSTRIEFWRLPSYLQVASRFALATVQTRSRDALHEVFGMGLQLGFCNLFGYAIVDSCGKHGCLGIRKHRTSLLLNSNCEPPAISQHLALSFALASLLGMQ